MLQDEREKYHNKLIVAYVTAHLIKPQRQPKNGSVAAVFGRGDRI